MGGIVYDTIPIIKVGEIITPKELPTPDFVVRLPTPKSIAEGEEEMVTVSIPTIKVVKEPEVKPKTPEVISVYDDPGEIGVGCVTAEKGLRDYMEDTYQISRKGPYDFYAVYDGHGGSEVSILLEDNFHKYIFEALDRVPGLRIEKELSSETIEEIKNNVAGAFEIYDDYLYENRERLGILHDGSTATMVIDIGDYLIFGNLGDSRSILVRDGKVVFSTQDHKPLEEEARIKAAGSFVSFWGTWRVGGLLAVSRAFGDFDEGMKVFDGEYRGFEAPVSVFPDVTVIRKNPGKNDYIVLASDGLWDVFSSEAVALSVNEYVTSWGVGDICKRLVKEAILNRGSRDNTTAMVFKVE